MPDALSKTIPIWCAVINNLLFQETHGRSMLCTPNEVIDASEHAQIEALIDDFVEQAKVRAILKLEQSKC